MNRRLLAALLSVVAVPLVGCGDSTKHHQRTHPVAAQSRPLPVEVGGVPGPPAPPQCATAPDGSHYLGSCAPKLVGAAPPVGAPQGITGPDISNNDPIVGIGHWQAVARAGHPFEYSKVAESSTYTDKYAAGATSAAIHVKILPGGYLFVHLCQGSATTQGQFFLRLLKADHLLGPGRLPPVLDIEYPQTTGCSTTQARRFIVTILRVVRKGAHTRLGIYTGAWYSNPKWGCWWPKGVIAWISGYTNSGPPRPCGLKRQEDLWQYTDKGSNGWSRSDMNLWRHSRTALNTLASNSTGGKSHTKKHAKHHARRHH